MRGDIQELESTLKATELRCVDPGIRSTSEDAYPAVKAAYPSLCDDSLRCEDVCSNGTDQPEWKHAVRRVQQQLAEHDDSRVNRHPEYGMWEISHPDLYLIPVSDDWLPQYHSTVVDPVSNSYAADIPSMISPALPARIWGTTEGPQTKRYFESMSPGDWLLFYHDGDFIGGGQAGRTFEDPTSVRGSGTTLPAGICSPSRRTETGDLLSIASGTHSDMMASLAYRDLCGSNRTESPRSDPTVPRLNNCCTAQSPPRQVTPID